MIRRTLRVIKALTVITVAEHAEYRAAVFIWMLAGTLPLIMMFVWMSIANDGAVAGRDAADFARYFLLAFLIGQMTQVWVVYELDQAIRLGQMSMQLLRPFDPYLNQAIHNLVSNTMRLPIVAVITVIGLVLTGALSGLSLGRLPLFLLAAVGAWLIAFNLAFTLGLFTFWSGRATALEGWYYIAGAVLSGQLFPLDLLPAAMLRIVGFTPFPYIVNFPVEVMLGRISTGESLGGLGVQVLWIVLFVGAHRLLWRAGLRRYGAVGA